MKILRQNKGVALRVLKNSTKTKIFKKMAYKGVKR
jgi:hypothetical protein